MADTNARIQSLSGEFRKHQDDLVSIHRRLSSVEGVILEVSQGVERLEVRSKAAVPQLSTKWQKAAVVIPLLSLLLAAAGMGVGFWQVHLGKKSLQGQVTRLQADLQLVTAFVAPQLVNRLGPVITAAVTSSNENARAAANRTSQTFEALHRSNVRLPSDQTTEVSLAMERLTEAHSNIPEVWQAASQVVSFRSGVTPTKNLGYCVDRPWTELGSSPIGPMPNGVVGIDQLLFHDCTIVLDDVSAFLSSAAWRQYEKDKRIAGNLIVAYGFERVHVIYRGGPVLPKAATFVFKDCTFDFQSTESPSPQGRTVTQRLLAAGDLDNVTVDVLVS